MISQDSLRSRIKEATNGLHTRLDQDPLGLKLMSPTATRADYANFLARTYGFMQPIGTLLQNASIPPVWPTTDDRTPRIVNDLLAIGVDAREIENLPRMTQLPRAETIGHAMGTLYVLEGSMMGGLVMAKSTVRTLALTPDQVTFFLPSEPKAIVQRFQSFVELLDGFARCECDETEALEAALETFRCIDHWFQTAPQPNLIPA